MHWNRLARWSAPEFMLGGGSVAAGLVLIPLSEAGATGVFPLVVALFLLGAAAIIIGLLGLRTRLWGSAPRLASSGAAVVLAFVALTAVALLAIGTLAVLAGLGVHGPAPPEFGLATGPLFAAIILGHAIYGIASWRTRVPSRTFGGVLLAAAALWVVAFAVGTRSQEFDRLDLVAFLAPAVATIIAGYLVRDGATTATGAPDRSNASLQ